VDFIAFIPAVIALGTGTYLAAVRLDIVASHWEAAYAYIPDAVTTQ
jgi:hypothetical protein